MKKSIRVFLCTLLVLIMMAALTVGAFADGEKKSAEDAEITDLTDPIVDLIDSLFGPLMAIVGAVGALYCVILGVKYAKAEEPQDREKAKSHLKNAVIGFVLIFILLLALKILTPALGNWVTKNELA